jgi:hypothetical protein
MGKKFSRFMVLGLITLCLTSIANADQDLNSRLDTMGNLFNTFSNAVAAQEMDMNFYLTELNQMNQIGNGIAGYLQGLNPNALSEAIKEAA